MSTMLKSNRSFGNLKRFLSEVWGELKKVQWPSRDELYGFTLMVIVAIVALGAYLGVLDAVLSRVSDVVFHMKPGGQ